MYLLCKRFLLHYTRVDPIELVDPSAYLLERLLLSRYSLGSRNGARQGQSDDHDLTCYSSTHVQTVRKSPRRHPRGR